MLLAYVEQCLVPTLKRNDIVVIDELAEDGRPSGWSAAKAGMAAYFAVSVVILGLPRTKATGVRLSDKGLYLLARSPDKIVFFTGLCSAESGTVEPLQGRLAE